MLSLRCLRAPCPRAPRRLFSLLLVGLLSAGLGACGPEPERTEPSGPDSATTAVIQVRDFGTIRIRFFVEKAPHHVENFLKLAASGFYDGTTFHRVIPGFMIQGGDSNSKDDDPTNDGFGGPGYELSAEFNDIPHRRGIVSMARRADPNSAGSQFFVMHEDSPGWAEILDGKFTVFGEVIEGIEVVDEIVEVERDAKDRPLSDVVIESIRTGS